jgi:hypothetical protein
MASAAIWAGRVTDWRAMLDDREGATRIVRRALDLAGEYCVA